MDYKGWLIPKLKQLNANRQFLANCPEQIETLRMKRESIRAAKLDKDVVDGTMSSREDMYITSLFEEEKLESSYAYITREVDTLEKALDSLQSNERLILERMYIRDEKNAVDRLSEELFVERSQIYNIKDKALINLARKLFGVVEL